MKNKELLIIAGLLLSVYAHAQTITYSDNWHKVQTSYGYIDLGPHNADWAHIYTDRPKFIFNKDVYLHNGVLSSYSSSNLQLRTNGTTRVFVDNSTGNVGIGTTDPDEKLEVNGNILLPGYRKLTQKSGSYYYSELLTTGHGQGAGWMINAKYDESGDPPSNVTYAVNPGNYNTGAGYLDFDGNGKRWTFYTAPTSTGVGQSVAFRAIAIFDDSHVSLSASGNAHDFFLNSSANLGLGTSTPSEKLEVNGTIRSKEVKVEASPWPDYVFAEDYDLMSLAEISHYIADNKHLPGMPSAEEVAKEGVALGKMNAKLLEKVEELTLHVISLQNQLHQQQLEIALLKKSE
ncbi:hypothetical protein [Marinoscillum sp.]|uniref:hypothetical protein n=1 Tax=Marinoscillum sp. TaxID=2024838 RepID=UPI003BABED77